MTPADILVLIAWAAQVSGYSIPPDRLEIHYVPHYVLEQFVCGKPCPVVGWTNPNTQPITIWIDDEHRNDPRILVHEAIHVGQTLAHKFNLFDCQQAHAAELEAYAFQDMYAEKNGLPISGPRMAECRAPVVTATRNGK